MATGKAHRIVQAVSDASGISVEAMYSTSRLSRVSQTRYIAMRLMREIHGWSYPRIGRVFGFDHSSVYKGMQRLEKLMEDPKHWKLVKTYETAKSRLETTE